jgi:hypothetical protein
MYSSISGMPADWHAEAPFASVFCSTQQGAKGESELRNAAGLASEGLLELKKRSVSGIWIRQEEHRAFVRIFFVFCREVFGQEASFI